MKARNGCDISFDLVDCAMIASSRAFGSSILVAIEQIMPNTWLLASVLPSSRSEIGTAAVIETSAREVPPLFRRLQEAGRVPVDEMRRTFNMGLGMILVVGPERADAALEELAARGGGVARLVGEIVAADTPAVSYK